MITEKSMTAVLLYRAFIVGSLMYTVGYLGWSPWWLLLLLTLVTIDHRNKE